MIDIAPKAGLLPLFTLTLALFGGAASNAQEKGYGQDRNPGRMERPEAAAQAALQALPRLVTRDNAEAMGFRSVDEARAATLGSPTTRRTIGYERMLRYQEGTGLDQLFEPHEDRIYPVLAYGEIKTSIAVAQDEAGWRILTIGDRYLAGLLSARVERSAGDSLELISLPGINFDLLRITKGSQTLLQPTRDLPEAQLVEGRPVRAEEALSAISRYVKEFDAKFGEEIRRRRLAY